MGGYSFENDVLRKYTEEFLWFFPQSKVNPFIALIGQKLPE
jgi:hypothetical protein